jgi:hypothetical protein
LIAGLACAVLPVSASAQTVGNDQIKQLQDEIRQIQKQYQSQIRGLQKQLDDLKAAQAAPKAPPPAPLAPVAWRCRRRAACSRRRCRVDWGRRRLRLHRVKSPPPPSEEFSGPASM